MCLFSSRRILERYGMSDCKAAPTPGDSRQRLTREMCPIDDLERLEMNKIPFREAVGSLMFCMLCTRPDIAYEVSRVAQFCDNPGMLHWKALKRILRYLKGTRDTCLAYGLEINHPIEDPSDEECRTSTNSLRPFAFCDSDWAANQDHRRSTFGYLVLLNGGPVGWTSRVQKSVATSMTEAEYVALSETAKEVSWIRRFMCDVGYTQEGPTSLMSDNQGAICLTKNPEFHQRTKHIDVRYHYIREEQASRRIKVEYTPTNRQPADMLTKSLTGPSLINCRRMINM